MSHYNLGKEANNLQNQARTTCITLNPFISKHKPDLVPEKCFRNIFILWLLVIIKDTAHSKRINTESVYIL